MTLGGLRFFSWLQRLPPSVAVATSALGPLLSRPCGLASHSGHSPGRRRPCLGPGSAVQGVWWLFPGPPCAPLKGGGQQLAGSRPRASVCMCVCTCVFPHVCPYLTCKNAPYSAPPTSNTSPTAPPHSNNIPTARDSGAGQALPAGKWKPSGACPWNFNFPFILVCDPGPLLSVPVTSGLVGNGELSNPLPTAQGPL